MLAQGITDLTRCDAQDTRRFGLHPAGALHGCDQFVLVELNLRAVGISRHKSHRVGMPRQELPFVKFYIFTIAERDRDLGVKNNQFVFLAGRIEPGRNNFAQRFTLNSFGSLNWYDHTSICEQSHHIAYTYTTAQYASGKWTTGPNHMKPDTLNAEFVIFFGTSPFEANFGPTIMFLCAE